MANLPPKPLDPPPIQRQERRHPNDNHDNHSTRSSQSRGRERPLSSNDRFYVPRMRSEYDSYAPGYDRRRDVDPRRRDYIDRERDRGRGVWERTGDIRDRDRGSRFVEPDPDDRDRRGYRERGYDKERARSPPHSRHRDSYDRRDHRPPSPIRPDAYRRSSRSPVRRRPVSPPPYRPKPNSRPHSRSPPAKRMRFERPSNVASPRSRSPLGTAHESPLTPRTSELPMTQIHVEQSQPSTLPPQDPQENLNTTTDGIDDGRSPPSLSHSERSTESSLPAQHRQGPDHSEPSPEEHKDRTPVATSGGFDTKEANHNTDDIQMDPKEDESDRKSNVKVVDRSPSPPRHPRIRNVQPPSAMQHRRQSRSPPRGPRNHSRNITTSTTSSSFPPAGLPRGPRRQHPTPTSVVSQDPKPSIFPDEPSAPQIGPDGKLPVPLIPQKPRPSLTHELDTEVLRLQTHRAHLASEYIQILKGTRRALHELDVVTLDLRAAEGRRKVADSQVEKARAGVLGIDADPTVSET